MTPTEFAQPSRKKSLSWWKPWASLVRIPNTLTAVADIFAGGAVAYGSLPNESSVNQGVELVLDPARFGLLAIASISFYWGGMVLNDVFDVDEDSKNQRARPIPKGEIGLAAANRFGWFLILFGILLAGFLPLTTTGYVKLASFIPLFVAIGLATCIVAYDHWLKKLWIAPWMMGLCRGFNILLGASFILHSATSIDMISLRPLLFLVIGHSLYVAGFTWAARRESIQSDRRMLIFGWSISALGICCLAWVPMFALNRSQLYMDPTRFYPLFVFVLSFPAIRRAWVACRSLSRTAVQNSIKQAIMTIILLDAAATLEFAGPVYGSICCLMLLPSIWMGTWFRST